MRSLSKFYHRKMSLLTNADIKSILKFIQELHIPCSLEAFTERVISILPQVVPSDFTVYCFTNFQKRSISSYTSHPVDRLQHEQVAHEHFYEHPLVVNYLRTGDGKAYKISDFLSSSQLYALEGLYQKVLRPLGLEDQMAMYLPNSPGTNAQKKLADVQKEKVAIALHRKQRDFSERDRIVLNLLRPHLLGAYQNAQALTVMQQELAQLNWGVEQLNAIILAGDGKVRLITQRAWALLKQYFQVSSKQSTILPENLQRWLNHQISLLTQNGDIPSPSLPLQLEREGKRLSIRFVADRPGEQYLLLLEEVPQRTFSAKSLELLGLTKREAEVLFWVAKEKSNVEIAAILGCADTTVKKHLEHIYSKLGVQTRAAAVMCALDKLGALN